MRRLLLFLGLLTGCTIFCASVIFAEDRVSFTSTVPPFGVEAETMEGTVRGQVSSLAWKGHVTFTTDIEAKEKGKSSYHVDGKAEQATFTGQKGARLVRLLTVKGIAPSLTIIDRATKEKTTLTGETIEFAVDGNKVTVTKNVRLQSERNATLLTCQRLETVTSARGDLSAMRALGDVVFSAVLQQHPEETPQKVDGRAGQATYVTVPAADQTLTHLIRLERGEQGVQPSLTIVDVTTHEKTTSGKAPLITFNLDTGDLYMGKQPDLKLGGGV